MTEKDYALVAAALRRQRPTVLTMTPASLAWEMIVQELRDTFDDYSPMFNADVFLTACGVPEAESVDA